MALPLEPSNPAPRPRDYTPSDAGEGDPAGAGRDLDADEWLRDDGLPWAPPPAWARGMPTLPAGDDLPGFATGSRPTGQFAPRPREPSWWETALAAFKDDRRLQLAALGLLAVLILLPSLWPRAEPGLSIASLHRQAAQLDGRMVRVRGLVAEVFPVGSGYAFTLVQGRDSLVVFTRSRLPRTHERVEVMGNVQAAKLDGRPRVALFERKPSR